MYSNKSGGIMEFYDEDIKYLKLLSKQYPTIAAASTEIINLEAILNLPKGTEHFLADIHGEYQPFVVFRIPPVRPVVPESF